MSSTNRGYERHKNDYYVTPIHNIVEFLEVFNQYEELDNIKVILDPSSGGDSENKMSYPEALRNTYFNNALIKTIDIRDDSPAEIKGDYLNLKLDYKPDMIITNPPFSLAKEYVEKALNDVKDEGYVIILQRLNFLGSKSRKEFWDNNPPKYIFVHHKRISFTPDGKTDSIEYAHFVWQKGNKEKLAKLLVI